MVRDRKYSGDAKERARQRSRASYYKKTGQPFKIVNGKVHKCAMDDPDVILKEVSTEPTIITTDLLEMSPVDIIQKHKTDDWSASTINVILKEKWDRERAQHEAVRHPVKDLDIPPQIADEIRKLSDNLASHYTKTKPIPMDELPRS